MEKELKIILNSHKKWLNNEINGKKADLWGADLEEAYLEGADLRGANLKNIKNYSESHQIFEELIRKKNHMTFTNHQWSIIGKICIHKLCWFTIKKRFSKNQMIKIFKILANNGWNEYLVKYKESIK